MKARTAKLVVTSILSSVGRMANGVAAAGGKMSILPEQN